MGVAKVLPPKGRAATTARLNSPAKPEPTQSTVSRPHPELCRNLGDESKSGGAVFLVIFRSPVGEDDPLDDPRQRWGVFQAAPFFCGGLNELEDPPLGRCRQQRALGTHGAVADD